MVFKLIKDEGMSQKEVAILMDLSTRTVEVHLKLAIKDLRKTIKDYFDESQKEIPLVRNKNYGMRLFNFIY